MVLEDYNCVLCSRSCEETLLHLFFKCPFSQDCWNSIPISWNLNLPPLDMVIEARSNFDSPIFREIFISACWTIWKARNGIIFNKNLFQWWNGKQLSEKTLAWFASKLRRALLILFLCGERVAYDVLVF